MRENFFKRSMAMLLAFILVFSLAGCLSFSYYEESANQTVVEVDSPQSFNIESIPKYSGEPFVYVNNNNPFFTEAEITTEAFEQYSPLDSLGRTRAAFACLGNETQPADSENRGSISHVRPSGWENPIDGTSNNARYDCVEGGYLYNRCHLIAWSLSAENDNANNLITGTRYMNVDAMLDFEMDILDYLDENPENHVMYRVTPVYEDENLLSNGVLIEAYSVEDEGKLSFCVFAYNVQPGIFIDYTNGDNGYSGEFLDITSSTVIFNENTLSGRNEGEAQKYILNTNSKKVHMDFCKYAEDIAEKNRQEVNESLQHLIEGGYSTCKVCLGTE